jgi:hypothetical protein
MYVFSVYVLLTIDVYDDDENFLFNQVFKWQKKKIMKNIMLHYQI